MADLLGQPAEIRFTITITRAATGAVETYQMVGRVNPQPQPETQPEQIENVRHALDGSA